VFKSAI